MDFNSNASLDSSQMLPSAGGGGGGRGGGVAIGGGLGLVITIICLLLGVNPGNVLGGANVDPASGAGGTTTSQGGTSDYAECTNTSQIKTNRACRWVAYQTSIQSYWATQLNGYRKAPVQPFSGQVRTGCGTASSEVGPFYCSADQKVWIDTDFADQLLQQLGARGGDAAEAYIMAHEYGHHIQHLTGQLEKAQQGSQKGADSASVRLELQADCYAGVWFKAAQQDPSGIITGVTQDDLDRIVDAAAAVGDDRIQQQSSGRVSPESWTHGSAKQRQYWVGQGFSSGRPQSCDTFSTNNLGG